MKTVLALAFGFLLSLNTSFATTEESEVSVDTAPPIDLMDIAPPAELSGAEAAEMEARHEAMMARKMKQMKKMKMGEDYHQDDFRGRGMKGAWGEKEGGYGKKWKKDKWEGKNYGYVILHKVIFAVFVLFFLFLASFAIRRGWEMGERKGKSKGKS